MRKAKGGAAAQLAAAAVVAAIAVAIAAALMLEPKQRLAGTSSIAPDAFPATVAPGRDLCMRNVLMPAGSAAFRLRARSAGASIPAVTMTIERAGALVTRRSAAPHLPSPGLVVFPIPEQRRSTAGNVICLRAGAGKLRVAGSLGAAARLSSTPTVNGHPRDFGISFDFTRRGQETGLELIPTVFHRASLFKPGWVGPWTFYALIGLGLLMVVAAAGLLIRCRERPAGRVELGALFATAALAAALWSVVSPAFQPPDEVSHYAYVESLVQRGKAPSAETSEQSSLTPEELNAQNYAAAGIILRSYARPPWTALEENEWRDVQRRLGAHAREGGGGYTSVAGYSPVYYALEAPGYLAGEGGSVFDRLWLMRLISILMAAGAALFAALFVRELAPGISWAAPTAGLAVAFEPMFGFISGSINNDNLLILSAAALLYLLARVLRRGLSVRLGLAIGAVLGLGVAAKPSMFGLAPAAVLTLAWVAYRDRASARSSDASWALAAAAGSFVLLAALRYGLLKTDSGAESIVSGGGDSSPSFFLSYMWQWYLPRLPSQNELFPVHGLPAYDVFFKGFWANFGHLDTRFPEIVYTALLTFCLAGIALAVVAVWRRSDPLRTIPKLLLGLVAVAGLVLLVNLVSYAVYVGERHVFAQGRYLLPLITVFGAGVALAALGFGRRQGAVAATAIIVAMAFFDLFSMGLTLERFYT